MQVQVVVSMESRPVAVHGRYGDLIGWFQRGGFLGNNQKPVGLVEFPDGTPAKVDLWRRYGYIASRPVGAVKSDGYCEHTLEAALWCFLNTRSYEDCVLKAVELGDDTDTTAAVAGALAGTYYGFEAIPPKWVGQPRGKAVIEQCI